MANPVQVGILMGSKSDLPAMSAAGDVLDQLGIGYDIRIMSAHRTPAEADAKDEPPGAVAAAGATTSLHGSKPVPPRSGLKQPCFFAGSHTNSVRVLRDPLMHQAHALDGNW